MKIVPVIDLLKGEVVRGIAGRRHEYRPIVSRLTATCAPVAVARAFREHFGFTEIYLADLDALAGSSPALDTYAAMSADGFHLSVDAGIRRLQDAVPLAEAGVETIVAGLETIPGPDALAELCREFGSRILFSLDLKDGQPFFASKSWASCSPAEIAAEAANCGVRRLLVLDLGRVGTGQGIGTESLCREVLRTHPDIELWAGGGVRNMSDLERLKDCGIHAVLVASALHDGTIRVNGRS